MIKEKSLVDYCKRPVHLLLCCLLLLVPCYLFPFTVAAQSVKKTESEATNPANYKILEEHKDKDGNIVRTVQYSKGNSKVTETQLIRVVTNLHTPINPDTLNKDSVTIVVKKSHYVVEVYYRRHIIRSYKAVFGPKPLENKVMEGDRCTPEGWFTIMTKNPNSKYHKFLLLDYPNDSAVMRFNDMKAKRTIPREAKIGGSVGIHGIWKGGDDMIEKGVCWTDGCVAIKNQDMDELFSMVGVGTRVYIKK